MSATANADALALRVAELEKRCWSLVDALDGEGDADSIYDPLEELREFLPARAKEPE